MRVGRFGVLLAGLALGAAACGTQAASHGGQGDVLAAAVSQTTAQTARVAITTSVREQGMTMSFTATGMFDFAHSRGAVSMGSPVHMKEIFLPPKIYLKLPSSSGTGLPTGKSWLAISDASLGSGGASAPVGMFGGTSSPADMLASLTAISGGEKKAGTATIRGVPVTEYRVNIDPAKAAARLPSAERASFRQFVKLLGSGTIPVHVWVDSKNLVRRVQMTLQPPEPPVAGLTPSSPASSGSGIPSGTGPSGGNFQVSESIDFYDFGVPVQVSAPPAAQVAGMSDLGASLATRSSPPKATGTLTPGQRTAAGQAATAFWTALGKNDPAAIARTVLPAQHACAQSNYAGGPKMTVNSFRIVSIEPAGTGKATVRYKVNAKVQGMAGILPKNAVLWMSTTERGGQWYVNLNAGTLFDGSCS